MVLQQRRECPACGGIGYKLKVETAMIEVHVPGEGNKYPDMVEGDVILQLRVKKHAVYNRKGADLGMNYELSLRQALCGYKIKIPHVSGKMLCITPYDQTEIVQPGSLKIVHTLGLPQRFSPHVKGHLYIVMDVKMPIYGELKNGKDVVRQFEKILPQQNVSDGDEDE